MLKLRVMPTLLFKDTGLVKGEAFDSWRRVGSALQAIKVYNLREVDELVFLDIAATRGGRAPDFETVDELADDCFTPLTVGGGVRTVDDVGRLLRVGADKVSINSGAIDSPELVLAAAAEFGTQCVVLSIDVRRHADGGLEVFDRCGRRATGREPVAWAREVERLGAGEVLLTSLDRDGTMEGYDIDLVRRVCDALTIPVIASGGAGSCADMTAGVVEGHAAAVAAASIFHFTEQTPRDVKLNLRAAGLPVRL